MFHTQFRYHLLQHILLRQMPLLNSVKNPISINDNACIQICHGKQKPDIKHINFERIQIHEINFPYRKRSSLIKRFIVRPPCQWNLYVAFLITLYHISLWQSRQHFQGRICVMMLHVSGRICVVISHVSGYDSIMKVGTINLQSFCFCK